MVKNLEFSTSISYGVPDFNWNIEIERVHHPNSDIVVNFVKCDTLYAREAIYGDYEDNAERAIFFSKAVLEFLKYTDWKPQIIHCNDWQTALIPLLLREQYTSPEYQDIRTLLTIHNLAYQGIFPREKFDKIGVDRDLFNQKGLAYHGKFNFLKTGILYADLINTVSPQYAKEIQTKEFGVGLEDLLKSRRADLAGIMNGIDYDLWDPSNDPLIWVNYNKNTLEKKQQNKSNLQKYCNLPHQNIPIVGMISRLVDQKGFDLIGEILDELMELELQFILLGTGEAKYIDIFNQLSEEYPSKTAIFLKFDNGLAHKIEAGADFFLMPSKYEPCGLNQLISLRYGTIPIVRHTGGLADSVSPRISSAPSEGIGFVFDHYASQDLFHTIERALEFYQNTTERLQAMRRGMEQDFSWNVSAEKYVKLYRQIIQKT